MGQRSRCGLMPAIIRGAVPVALLLVACGEPGSSPVEPVRPVPLPIDLGPDAGGLEYSGICWWGDDLLILPQFPTGPGGQGVLLLSRTELARAIDEIGQGGPVTPLRPRRIRAEAEGVVDSIPHYDGLEAIAIRGDRCYALAEYGDPHTGVWGSRLLAGRLHRGPDVVRFERLGAIRLEGPQMRTNFTCESLILSGDEIWVLSELNGVGVVDEPWLLRFGPGLESRGAWPMVDLEYRVTDATDLEPGGRFWVLNLFWPQDLEVVRPRRGGDPVERLVPLRFLQDRVILDPERPILDLRRDPRDAMHNWEGVARWENEGLLLVADSYPSDVLAYVALPR